MVTSDCPLRRGLRKLNSAMLLVTMDRGVDQEWNKYLGMTSLRDGELNQNHRAQPNGFQ